MNTSFCCSLGDYKLSSLSFKFRRTRKLSLNFVYRLVNSRYFRKKLHMGFVWNSVCPQTRSHTVTCKDYLTASKTVFCADAVKRKQVFPVEWLFFRNNFQGFNENKSSKESRSYMCIKLKTSMHYTKTAQQITNKNIRGK